MLSWVSFYIDQAAVPARNLTRTSHHPYHDNAGTDLTESLITTMNNVKWCSADPVRLSSRTSFLLEFELGLVDVSI